MKYTITDVTTNKLLVKFDDGSSALVKIQKSWDKERIEEQISRHIPTPKSEEKDEDFDSIEDVPFKIGDNNDIISYGERMAIKQKELQLKRKKEAEAEAQKRRELQEKQKQADMEARKSLEESRDMMLDSQISYIDARELAYPSISEQLDSLYRAGAFSQDMMDEIKRVKERYPKDMNPTTRREVYKTLEEDAATSKFATNTMVDQEIKTNYLKLLEFYMPQVEIDGELVEIPLESFKRTVSENKSPKLNNPIKVDPNE